MIGSSTSDATTNPGERYHWRIEIIISAIVEDVAGSCGEYPTTLFVMYARIMAATR
jgi:hypothetical protein